MKSDSTAFYGWRVVGGAFTLAVFSWGLGFYGPPIYLQAVHETRGWSLGLVSAAISTHFLLGAAVVANLQRLYRRLGIANVVKSGSLCLALGVVGWSQAQQPWQLFAATFFSGAGWAATGPATINAVLSPWFVHKRSAALSSAYNGASIGGVVFSPLWALSISYLGFPVASVIIGATTILVIWLLAEVFFRKTPIELGLSPDGLGFLPKVGLPPLSSSAQLTGSELWRNLRFVTLSAGMALGLFAQIGVLSQLFSILSSSFGVQLAGIAAGTATVAAITGRTLVGWLMPANADRRLVASLSYLVQIAGVIAFVLSKGDNAYLLMTGIVLFGLGIGNATSLPPLIAQVEFANPDVPRVVPLIVAISQAAYAFAPAAFGLIRQLATAHDATDRSDPAFFATAALLQAAAIALFLVGRRRQP